MAYSVSYKNQIVRILQASLPQGDLLYRWERSSPPPSVVKEGYLLEKQNRRPKSESLNRHNLRLVVYIYRKFENTGIGIDLVSIGAIGLIKAVNTFDPDKIKLATYASRCIENEILMYLRRNGKTARKFPLMNRSMWIGMGTNYCFRMFGNR